MMGARGHLVHQGLPRATGSVYLRAFVSFGLVGVVAAQIDWGACVERLSAGRWPLFSCAVALLLGALLLGAWRWHLLLGGAGLHSPAGRTLHAYAVGSFANNVLPTSFGGDALRAWLVGRSGQPLERAATTVLIDRATGLGCLVLVGWVCLALDPGEVPGTLALALLASTLFTVLSGAALVAGARFTGRLPARVRQAAATARTTALACVRDTSLLWKTVLLGSALQALTVLAGWLIAQALGLGVALSLLAVTFPCVLIITLVPISIAGFGLREGGYIVLLGQAGVTATDAALLSVLAAVALTLSTLPGALAMMARGTRGTLPQWGPLPEGGAR